MKEFEALLGPSILDPSRSVYTPENFPGGEPLPDVEEDAPTFKGNAVKKAVTVTQATGCITLAEDSGLCVNALGYRPGVLSAKWVREDASAEENNKHLLSLKEDLPFYERAAHFVSTLC